MRNFVEEVGFDPDYYTAIHRNFDLPYDIYRPESENPRTQIEIVQKNGSSLNFLAYPYRPISCRKPSW